jgi:thiosulfate/3-mercaptopyruvate sulfurtransferase
MFRLSCLALLLAGAGAAGEEVVVKAVNYPRAELLVEPSKLLGPGAPKGRVTLDARTKAKYLKGHVPGAVWVDTAGWARAFAKGQDKAEWSKRIGDLGIDVTTPVVVYDDARSKDAARVWWVLRYWGVRDVRLLNGGWLGWFLRGAIEKGENKPRTVAAKLEAQPRRLATKADLLKELKGKPGQVLDARSRDEFCGKAETAKRNGAIPGAVHLEWSDTVDKTGRFKSPLELARLFKDAGVDPRKGATTYCQSGGRAAVLAFVVELMGGKEVRNYYRSWSEWGNDPDVPIVRPKEKE